MKIIWYCLVNPNKWDDFFTADIETWLEMNLKKDLARVKEGQWKLWFNFTCWLLWWRRNREVFEDSKDFQMDEVVEIT